jgi:hypothetical protein
MKHLYYLLIISSLVLVLPSCKDKNSPAGTTTSSSYSGYAPDAKGVVGRWFDMRSNYVIFSYNGSAWDVKEGRILEALKAGVSVTNFSVSGGSVTYTQVDGYTATLKWSIDFSYTASGKNYSDTDTGDLTLHFTSYQGGYSSGYMNGKYESYREFALQ